jgi:hypothetical protein
MSGVQRQLRGPLAGRVELFQRTALFGEVLATLETEEAVA